MLCSLVKQSPPLGLAKGTTYRHLQSRMITSAMSINNIITDPKEAIRIAGEAKTVAVLGIRPAAFASKPAYFVPEFLQSTGVEIIPVDVHGTGEKDILDQPVLKALRDIKRHVDIVDIFRRPQDLHQHVDDILAMDPRPACVWLQSGISNPEVEKKLAEEGIKVVVSRCLKVDRASAGHRARF